MEENAMQRKQTLFTLLSLLIIASMMISACVTATQATLVPTEAQATVSRRNTN